MAEDGSIVDANAADARPYCIYVLYHSQLSCTYVGMTNNPRRRLRQHNGELVGGARYTTSRLGAGAWHYYMRVSGLTKREALSFERCIKNVRRRRGSSLSPIEHRMVAVERFVGRYPACEITLFE